MKKYLVPISYCLTFAAFSQENTHLLKSSLNHVGSSSIVLQGSQRSYLVQQSIGQMGIIGTVRVGNAGLQQGFLTHTIAISNGLSSAPALDLTAYPNPVADILTITFTHETQGPINVQLYDLTGRLIMDRDYEQSDEITLETFRLQEGTYILDVAFDSTTWSTKVIRKNQ